MRRKERETSDIRVIEEIIGKADVCRIAIVNDNIPYIVTMNFGYKNFKGASLYFHCANEGRKLEMIRKNNFVCFEMDTDHQIYEGIKGCDWGMKYSSLVGYGTISFVTEIGEKRSGLNYITRHYAGEKEFLFEEQMLDSITIPRLDIQEITGK